ncbi:nucleotide kinase domain-containing protein [Gaopeijia maritima]|uniref:nucleotide kinase domain-containing protein n=1 Tax=Gaopeijia maritima TaxID=3119007 RepID=UPI003244DC06
MFDSYWRFAARRQEVYLARLRGTAAPWTPDPILGAYRFTNAYRAADRVSQYLIRNVIYQTAVPLSDEDLVFRILLFKIFNRIETWELLRSALGPLTWRSFSYERYDTALTEAMASGRSIYSGAYIMPSVRAFGHPRKHRNHLLLIERMMRDGLANTVASAQGMRDVYASLLAYPSIGPFLAYQFAVDINYSELTDFSENDFVVAGPGAKDGIRKAFRDADRYDDADTIRFTTDLQGEEFARRGIEFPNLFGRPLQLIDCQNLFCEVSKYARVRHPNVTGVSGRTRIKQRFTAKGRLPLPWFPPKWGINDKASTFLKHESGGWN